MNPFLLAKTPGPSQFGRSLQKAQARKNNVRRGADIDLTPRTRGAISIESAAQSAVSRDRRAAMLRGGI